MLWWSVVILEYKVVVILHYMILYYTYVLSFSLELLPLKCLCTTLQCMHVNNIKIFGLHVSRNDQYLILVESHIYSALLIFIYFRHIPVCSFLTGGEAAVLILRPPTWTFYCISLQHGCCIKKDRFSFSSCCVFCRTHRGKMEFTVMEEAEGWGEVWGPDQASWLRGDTVTF